MQTLTIPLSLSSKVPQILSNYRDGSTGQLSAFLVFNSLAGCLARVFTSMTETNDPLLIAGFAGAALLNAVIAIQYLVYSGNKEAKVGAKVEESKYEAITEKKAVPEIGIGRAPGESAQGTPVRKATPGRTSSPASARYVRKLD